MAKNKSGKIACKHEECKAFIDKKEDQYCGKHQRDKYRDYERQHNVKICSIDRGCFNVCEEGFLACLQCIINDHIENNRYFERDLDNDSKCIDCLAMYDNTYPHSMALKRCESCCKVVLDKNKGRDEVTRCLNKTTSVKASYNMCIKGAADRNYDFTLSLKRFAEIVTQKCFYCGTIDKLNGIDRVDNSKHYIEGNVVSCCPTCNRMKHTMTIQEFVNKCSSIVKYTNTGISDTFSLCRQYPSFITIRNYSHGVYSRQAKDRQIVFELSKDEYHDFKKLPCYLCGLQTSGLHINGIDRLNNNEGYNMTSCCPCCGKCNTCKADIPIGIFYFKCAAIDKNELLLQFKTHVVEPNPIENVPTPIVEQSQDPMPDRFLLNNLVVLFNTNIQSAIDYCREHGKDDLFISRLKEIHEKRMDDEHVSIKIKALLHNNTKLHADQKDHDRKHLKAKEVLVMLENNKMSEYLEIFADMFETPSELHISDINTFLTDASSLTYDQKVERCRKILERERMRRNYLETVKRKKKIKTAVKPTNVIEHVVEDVLAVPDKPRVTVCESVCAVIPDVPTSSSLVVPKQWKVQQIYEFIRTGNAHYYKAYCEEFSDMKGSDWESDWNGFVMEVADLPFECAEPVIRTFIESLRTKRHNKLCVNRRNIVEREGRQIWPAETIARAYIDGKIARFKEFTEQTTGDDPADEKWQKRWLGFMKQLEENKSSVLQMLPYISKFLTAQRTKRYLRNKEALATNT